MRRLRVLAITQIWPNGLEPLSSPFNLQQFERLATRCDLGVLAAIAHVPGASLIGVPERAAMLAKLPARETIRGIETTYLRQLYVPKIGVPIAVPLYLASLAPHRALLREADVILATWAYPDGCASVIAARALGKPVAVKVHGSDVNVIAKRPSARAVLKRVLPKADAIVSVSRALSRELETMGVAPEKLHLVANGVDASRFALKDRAEARRALGLRADARVITFVGRLEPEKGVGELLEAFDRVRASMPDSVLALVGDGVWTARVNEAVAKSGGAIVAPGARPLDEVATWLAACDVFTLPSWREGTPNVVLEALASGRPVVASDVGGIPDVVTDPRAGTLVPAKDPEALARALASALDRAKKPANGGGWDPAVIRASGPASWDESAAKLWDVLRAIAGKEVE